MKKYAVIFGLVIFLLYSHILVLYGALKERKSRVCIDPATETRMNKIVETTKAVCADINKVRLEEIEVKEKKQKQDIVYWQKKLDVCIASSTL